MTIGRSVTCDVVLEPWLVYASSLHASLSLRPDSSDNGISTEEQLLWLTDLHSSNGTFVNKRRLPPGEDHAVPLHHGDVVVFGGMRDVEGELEADALQRAELVMWRVETATGVRDERRLFGELEGVEGVNGEERLTDTTAGHPPGLDALYEETPLTLLPQEEDLDKYTEYLLRRAAATAAGSSSGGGGAHNHPPRSPPPPLPTPSMNETPTRPTVALTTSTMQATSPTPAAEQPHTPTPQKSNATPGLVLDLCGLHSPGEGEDDESSGLAKPISALPELFPASSASTPQGKHAASPAARHRITGSHAQLSPFYFTSVRVGAWRLLLSGDGEATTTRSRPVHCFPLPSTGASLPPNQSPSSRKRTRSTTTAATTSSSSDGGAPAALTFSESHWLWPMRRPSDDTTIACVLPSSAIGTVLVCVEEDRCGLAIELHKSVTRLPCALPADVFLEEAGDPFLSSATAPHHPPPRWVVWCFERTSCDGGAASPPGPAASSTNPKKRLKAATATEQQPLPSLMESFGPWVVALYQSYRTVGLPEPHCVDGATFDYILGKAPSQEHKEEE